jgi:Fe2+ or Zn2+ uptake regulation protein
MHRDDGQTKFYICQNPHCNHHHHFICNTCQRVFEIDMCLAFEYDSHVSRQLDASITKHIIQFEGLCKICRLNISVKRSK